MGRCSRKRHMFRHIHHIQREASWRQWANRQMMIYVDLICFMGLEYFNYMNGLNVCFSNVGKSSLRPMESHLGRCDDDVSGKSWSVNSMSVAFMVGQAPEVFHSELFFPESPMVGNENKLLSCWVLGSLFRGELFLTFTELTMANGCEMVAFGNTNQ